MIPEEISRPGEVVCYKAFPFQTSLEGVFHIFFAIDMYSHYAISTPPFQEWNDASIMRQVDELMNEKDFQLMNKGPFVLVIDVGEDMLDELDIIVEPFGGRVVYDPKYIEENMMPDMGVLLEMMSRGGADSAR